MLLSRASCMAIVASRRSVPGVERCFDHVTAQMESLDLSELISLSDATSSKSERMCEVAITARGLGSKFHRVLTL